MGLDRSSAIQSLYSYEARILHETRRSRGLSNSPDLVGYERSLVCRWRNGIYLPRWDAIAAIARVTQGAVTAVDWTTAAGEEEATRRETGRQDAYRQETVG